MIKYIWSAAGYGLIAVPLLFTRTKQAIDVQTDATTPKDQTDHQSDNAVAHRTESKSRTLGTDLYIHPEFQKVIFRTDDCCYLLRTREVV